MDDIFGVTEIARQVNDVEAAPHTTDLVVNHTSQTSGQSPPLHAIAAGAPTDLASENQQQKEKAGYDGVEYIEEKL